MFFLDPEWLLSYCLWIEFNDNKNKQKVSGENIKTGIIDICLTW